MGGMSTESGAVVSNVITAVLIEQILCLKWSNCPQPEVFCSHWRIWISLKRTGIDSPWLWKLIPEIIDSAF